MVVSYSCNSTQQCFTLLMTSRKTETDTELNEALIKIFKSGNLEICGRIRFQLCCIIVSGYHLNHHVENMSDEVN